MSTSPATDPAQSRGIRRLLWLLMFFLLFIGGLNIFVSLVLPGAVQRWLQERGLEAQVAHVNVSLPRLRAHLRGVQVRNAFERGFSVREATLGLSWWKLLQGKIHVKETVLEGVYLDLESEPGERGRIWEIGGWHLGEGPKKPKNWRVDLAGAKLRDAVVCYQHKPQWKSPSCARIGALAMEDFFVAGFREKQEPLQFSIGADDFLLENMLAWDELPGQSYPSGLARKTQETGEGDMRKSPEENPTIALVRLKTGKIQFARPGNALTTAEVFTRKFAACPPDRWAQAVPGLRRITGHCATARRLQVKGPALFSFGKGAEIAWRRVEGQEVRLRYRNRRHPNWHAETIALNGFDYLRESKTLQWQSAGSSGFSWCPNRLRTGPEKPAAHHYCIRAGSLRLPQTTAIGWEQGLAVDLTEASLVQGSVVDLDANTPLEKPLTSNNLRLGALQYRNQSRRLRLQQLSLDGASGCVPGQLWGREDHCVFLSRLQVPENLTLQFARKVARGDALPQTWGLQSGPVQLAKLRLNTGKARGLASTGKPAPQNGIELTQLNWARMEISPTDQRYLVEDIALQQLRGCVPEGLTPLRLSPLCTSVQGLGAKGDFILALEDSPYLILGELGLESLLLSDHLSADPAQQTGLLVNQLHTGVGFFRLRSQQLRAGEYFATDDAFWWPGGAGQAASGSDPADDGAEKGQLPQDGTQSLAEHAGEDLLASPGGAEQGGSAGRAIGDMIAAREMELELSSLSLDRLDGCLPITWQALLASGAGKRRPECFAIRELQQKQPLNLAIDRKRSVATVAEDNTAGDRDTAADVATHSANRGSGGHFRLVFTAADLQLAQADIQGADKQPLLELSKLQLPKAALRIQSAASPSSSARMQLDIPGASLDKAAFCLSPARCVDLDKLHTGEQFSLDYDHNRFHADLKDLALQHFSLTGKSTDVTAEISQLASVSLRVNLPRNAGARTNWQLQDLQAAQLDFCWPSPGSPQQRLPRCVRGSDLQSVGNGLVLQSLALHRELEAAPQLQLGPLQIETLGMLQSRGTGQPPVQFNLHNIQLSSIHGCGLQEWLAAARQRGDASGRWGGCISSGNVHLSGDNLIPLGRTAAASENKTLNRLVLGPLSASDLRLVPAEGQAPALQLAQLQWQSLEWPGGARVQVEELNAVDFAGCLPSAAGVDDQQARCISFSQLHITGRQRLAAGEELRANGQIAVADFLFRQGERQRIGFSHLAVNGLVFSSDAMALQQGSLSGLSGCMSSFTLAEKAFSPCYRVGRVTVASEHKIRLGSFGSGASQRLFNNIRVEGVQVTQQDYPAGLPAQLLHIESLQAELLGFGSRQLLSKNLQIHNVSSCIPKGYINGINHCINLAEILTTGQFSFEQRQLDLTQATLRQLMVLDAGGDQLLESELIEARELAVARDKVRLLWLDIANSKLFRRSERAQDFVNHQWNTEVESLQLSQFNYDPASKALDIDTIDLIKPRSILARGIEGDLGAWERFRSETPELAQYQYRRGDIAREANRFKYRIRQVYVDRGRFLWMDNTGDYEAKVPIRRINLLLQGASNYHEDPPALVVFNARPGGFSEMHLAGQINLLENSHWDAGILGYVEGANLIPTTPYFAALLGYKILQGQLDAEVNVQVKDNQVDALAKMKLEKIKVRRVRDSDHLKVKKSIIPLSLALALMKDGNGDVRFKMPVTGELYDPKFSFSFIFSDLLQRAILEALFAYFTPVGLYSLAKLAWARFRAVSFSELEFTPGSDVLSARAEADLSEMIEKLRDNPKARPGICGVATAQDLEMMFPHEVGAMRAVARNTREDFYRDPPRGLREELLHLANRRSRHVQKFLIEAGLDQEDFIQCAPDYIGTDSGAPRVEFSN
ncbi:DUF748 domain-containing protein [Microbulbifer sp. ALW1]|uniref:DUF748 domain-containing protein n=1 Tax=Microbulbifer sp. (strain ALW1) TaxID=1516059 RepID=UPI001358421B|nr:DUF748 domain-containing protein [Microbulbifer sp. ALW1]